MRHYEIVLLIHPDQSEQVPAMLERYKTLVTAGGGKVHRVEDWGRRQLAYMIQKLAKAHYLCINIECEGKVLDELETGFRFNDAVLRHLTVVKSQAETAPSVMMRPSTARKRDAVTTVATIVVATAVAIAAVIVDPRATAIAAHRATAMSRDVPSLPPGDAGLTNRLALTAVIVEKGALRHTPAGLPALDVSLRHDSQVEQLGQPRKVAFEIRARAVGGVAELLQAAPLGEPCEIEGFIGPQRNGRGTVFHIERIEPKSRQKGIQHAPAPR